MVTQNVAEYPPHHVTHGSGKFEVATLTLKEMHLKEKMHSLTLTMALRSHEILPRNFYSMCHIHLQNLKSQCPTF